MMVSPSLCATKPLQCIAEWLATLLDDSANGKLNKDLCGDILLTKLAVCHVLVGGTHQKLLRPPCYLTLVQELK